MLITFLEEHFWKKFFVSSCQALLPEVWLQSIASTPSNKVSETDMSYPKIAYNLRIFTRLFSAYHRRKKRIFSLGSMHKNNNRCVFHNLTVRSPFSFLRACLIPTTGSKLGYSAQLFCRPILFHSA